MWFLARYFCSVCGYYQCGVGVIYIRQRIELVVLVPWPLIMISSSIFVDDDV